MTDLNTFKKVCEDVRGHIGDLVYKVTIEKKLDKKIVLDFVNKISKQIDILEKTIEAIEDSKEHISILDEATSILDEATDRINNSSERTIDFIDNKKRELKEYQMVK